MQETQVPPLSWDNSLEKEMATHSGILAWEIPWTEEPGGLQPMGLQRVRHDLVTKQQEQQQQQDHILLILKVKETFLTRKLPGGPKGSDAKLPIGLFLGIHLG